MSEMEELEELSRNFTSIHYIPAIYIPSIRYLAKYIYYIHRHSDPSSSVLSQFIRF